MTVKQLIIDHNEVFYKEPWYGESVIRTLESVSYKDINSKPEGANHSIAMLVDHMINWKKFGTEKISGNEGFDIILNTQADWNFDLIIRTEIEWANLINLLKFTHNEFIKNLEKQGDEWLKQKTPGRNYSNYHMVKGIIQHDVYHLGQIRLTQIIIKQAPSLKADNL